MFDCFLIDVIFLLYINFKKLSGFNYCNKDCRQMFDPYSLVLKDEFHVCEPPTLPVFGGHIECSELTLLRKRRDFGQKMYNNNLIYGHLKYSNVQQLLSCLRNPL